VADEPKSTAERLARLTACMAHDLKSPISAIISNAHYLLEDQSTAGTELSGAAQDIVGASDFMHSLLLDVEAVAAFEIGTLQAHRERVHLRELLDELRQDSETAVRERDHNLKISVTPPDAELQLDRTLTARILHNLIDNAVLHAPSRSAIEIQVSVNGTRELAIVVKDKGPVVPEEVRERLFSLYGRTERDKLPRIGRGLQLRFCKAAATVQGGTITVGDDGAGSSEFRVVIPEE
jgi:two-component system sensor histidine kinase VanS